MATHLQPLLAREAATVDNHASFPERALSELRRSGLMGVMVPQRYGGAGGDCHTMSQIARTLGEACMSTALIWAMHCQQVMVLADHATDDLRDEVLPAVADGRMYIASVTSEPGKGGLLLTAHAPLEREGDVLVLRRDAPTVTGGLQADGFLVTMRSNPDAPPEDVCLVWAAKPQLCIETSGEWDPMGARGTHSVSLHLEGRVPDRQIVGSRGFRTVAIVTMIPFGHVAWASSWLGAAIGAYRGMLNVFRDPQQRKGFDIASELFAEKLARVHMELAVVRVHLEDTVRRYQALRDREGMRLAAYELPSFQLQVNELKVMASERLFHAIDLLLELSGLRYGYVRNSPVPMERVFRDLRSASLMYGNERLLVANGRLALVDRAGVP